MNYFLNVSLYAYLCTHFSTHLCIYFHFNVLNISTRVGNYVFGIHPDAHICLIPFHVKRISNNTTASRFEYKFCWSSLQSQQTIEIVANEEKILHKFFRSLKFLDEIYIFLFSFQISNQSSSKQAHMKGRDKADDKSVVIQTDLCGVACAQYGRGLKIFDVQIWRISFVAC